MPNNIGINFIQTGIDSLIGKWKQFANTMNSTDKNIGKAGKSMAGLYNETRKVNNKFSNINKDLNRSANSINKISNGLNQVLGVGKMYAVARGLSTMIQSSLDAIEAQNLFNVAMGETAKTAQEFVDSVHKAYGFDTTNIQSAVASYSLLARSMGMSAQQAEILGTNTYKLGVDLASLTNVPINQVMQDLRSGLIGQTETVYKYGVDLTEASLGQEALAEGISKSVREMTQGEKMALRYNLLIKQTALAHGDFANTIMTPANQLKILSERFITLGRAIGNVFIPILSATLPYINAFVLALTDIANAVAKFFGYTPDTSGGSAGLKNNLGGVTDGATDASNALDKATKSAKELNNQTLGFDELHVNNPSSGSGAGSSAGGGASMLPNMDLSSFDNLMGKLRSTTDELSAKMKPVLEEILKLVGAIGLAFLSWKIANGVVAFLSSPLLAKVLVLFKGLMAGGGLAKIFTFDAGVLGAFASTIFVIIARTIQLIATNEDFRRGLKVIWDAMVAIANWVLNTGLPTIGKFLIDLVPDSVKADILAFGKLLSDAGIDINDFGIVLLGLALTISPVGVFGTALGTALLVFEAFTLAVRLLGEAFAPVVESTKGFGDQVSKATTDKLQPFMDKCGELQTVFTKLSFTGEVITQKTVDDVKTKVSDITKTIVNELDADKNSVLKDLDPLKNIMSAKDYSGLVDSLNSYYDTAKTTVQGNEAQINQIMATAKAEGRSLTEQELNKINELQKSSQDIGIRNITQNEVEYNAVMNRMKDNATAISVEQASNIIQNAVKTKDETIKSAEEQYSRIELEAQNMLDAGAINEEQYQKMIDSAKKAKDDTIADANEQYQSIVDTATNKLGDLANNIDMKTGEIKPKWKAFTDDLSKNYLASCKAMSDGFDNFVKNFKVGWDNFWKGVYNGMAGWVNSALKGMEDFVNGYIDGLNKAIYAWNVFKSATGISGWTPSVPRISLGRIPYLAKGGILDSGAMFVAGELGKAEAIGSYKGKTTVMPLENTDFVDAIYNAVASAMSSIDLSGQAIDNAIYLDGEVIYKNQQKIQRGRGVDFGMGVFAR